jgi:uncharacterized protein (DUF488 family)
MTIWTIGHSTHSIDNFTALLTQFSIELVADVRSFPGSRKFPQFNRESFRAYADHMGTEEFAAGVSKLLELAGKKRTAILCAESLWRRCHRVVHIMPDGGSEEHPYSSPAKVLDGRLSYAAD